MRSSRLLASCPIKKTDSNQIRLFEFNKTDMEAADIEDEFEQVWKTTTVSFSTYATVTPKQWEDLESHNCLNLIIGADTREGELPGFLTELWTKRKKLAWTLFMLCSSQIIAISRGMKGC